MTRLLKSTFRAAVEVDLGAAAAAAVAVLGGEAEGLGGLLRWKRLFSAAGGSESKAGSGDGSVTQRFGSSTADEGVLYFRCVHSVTNGIRLSEIGIDPLKALLLFLGDIKARDSFLRISHRQDHIRS